MGEPREPVTDPTLGVPVTVTGTGTPVHRLVVIGDSISQGFMSGAIFRTDLSWPNLVAHELGLGSTAFTYPVYEPPDGPGGLPLDLERLARGLAGQVGDKLDWWEAVKAGRWVRSYMDHVEDYWERGAGTVVPATPGPYDNLAVYGADVLDVQLMTGTVCDQRLAVEPKDNVLNQVVEHNNDLTWRTVLASCRDAAGAPGTVLDAARALGEDGGIETLTVVLGGNNALGSVIHLTPKWTPDDYLDTPPAERLDSKGAFNVWQPAHFAAEWATLVEAIKLIDARHVLVSTVPQVTIAPIAHGVGGKVAPGSRYFEYYTRPWIDDNDFDPRHDPNFTSDQARAIDEAIDAYNGTIIESVRQARTEGRDWYVLELGGLLDSLAVRRYIDDPSARPPWWKPYVLPPELTALPGGPPTTRFFHADRSGRTDGGLFSLDGVHPTTIGYGIVAREVVALLRDHAKVDFFAADGTLRNPTTVDVDFARVVAADTLVGSPPEDISSTLGLLGWLDQTMDWVSRLLPFR